MKRSRSGVLLIIWLATAVVSGIADETDPVLFAEPFTGSLDPGWSWVREDPTAWRIERGMLRIRTSFGALWMKDNNARNILLRTPPESRVNYAVEVRVENEPTAPYEHAGLVWYEDDDNYVVLLKEKVGARQVVQLVSETDGRPKVGFAERPFEGRSVQLRMTIAGATVRGQFRASSEDDWQTLGECAAPGRAKARVGLITGYAPKDAEHQARFDGFRIVAHK